MKQFTKGLKWIDSNFEPFCMAITFYALMLLITVQVILRFVFKGGFAWGEEISRFIFVWLVFLGAPFLTRNNRHIGLSFIRDILPKPVGKALIIIIDLMCLGLVVVLLYASIKAAQTTAKFGDMATTAKISMNWLFFAPCVGYSLMLIRSVQTVIWRLIHVKSSFELFKNPNGRYSGSDNLFFATGRNKEDLEKAHDPAIDAELEAFKARKKGGDRA